MSERRAEIAGGSRRAFLRSSGLAAGGAALIGANLPAATQTPNSDQDAPVKAERSIVRASAQAQNPNGAPAGGPPHPIRASRCGDERGAPYRAGPVALCARDRRAQAGSDRVPPGLHTPRNFDPGARCRHTHNKRRPDHQGRRLESEKCKLPARCTASHVRVQADITMGRRTNHWFVAEFSVFL
jgi:hypothetical protein